jgi:hypothetical protein
VTTYLRTNQASLYLDSLLCTGRTTDSAGNVFTIDAQANNASWGAAAPIDVAVQRWMTDGAVVATQGYENREISFQVKIAAASSTALAAGEAALTEAALAAAQLIWVPPEGSITAPETVFDIWTCHLSHAFDLDEENRLTRTFVVTATAKPWARSLGLTVESAVPTAGAGTTASVDAGTSTTGWTGSPNAPSVFSATAIRESRPTVLADLFARSVTLSLTRTGSVTGMGTTPYLAIDYRTVGGKILSASVKVDGVACTRVSSSGTTRYWKVPAGVTSFTTLKVEVQLSVVIIGTTQTLDIYDVTRSSVAGVMATHKMFNRHLDVGGSVPTSGSIQLASPSATVLGNVLVYTCPDTGSGYAPPLRPYRVGGGTVTADATMVSGARETITSTILYDIPANVLRKGTYAVVARLNFTATGSAVIALSTLYPGTSSAAEILRPTISQTGAAVVWAILGVLNVPATDQPADSQVSTRIGFSGALGSGTLPTLDELFLLDVTHGAFTLFTLATSLAFAASPTQLWLDSPDADLSNNQPHIYYGANADRSDATQVPYPQIASFGDHDLDPNGTTVFTVTDGVDDAVVTANYYQRWHTNAAL